MFRSVGKINFGKIEESIPAFLTIILIPLTFSITPGNSVGLHFACWLVPDRRTASRYSSSDVRAGACFDWIATAGTCEVFVRKVYLLNHSKLKISQVRNATFPNLRDFLA